MKRPEFQLRHVENADPISPAGMPTEVDVHVEGAALQRRQMVVGAGMALLAGNAVQRAVADTSFSKPILAHHGRIRGIAWDEKSQWLASIADDGALKLWDFPYCTLGWIGRSKGKPLRSLDCDESFIYTGDSEGILSKWRVSDGKPVWHFKTPARAVETLALTARKRRLIFGSGSEPSLHLSHALSGELLSERLQLGEVVTALAARPTSEREWVLGTQSGQLQYWVRQHGELLADFSQPIRHIEFTKSGRVCACATGDGKIAIFVAKSKKQTHTIDARSGSEPAIALDPSGNWISAAGLDRVIRVWGAGSSKPIREIDASVHSTAIVSLASSENGRWLASGDQAGSIAIWDVREGKWLAWLYDPMANLAARAKEKVDLSKVEGKKRSDRRPGQTHTKRLPGQGLAQDTRCSSLPFFFSSRCFPCRVVVLTG